MLALDASRTHHAVCWPADLPRVTLRCARRRLRAGWSWTVACVTEIEHKNACVLKEAHNHVDFQPHVSTQTPLCLHAQNSTAPQAMWRLTPFPRHHPVHSWWVCVLHIE